jgi:uncharacterized membrane protein YdjX (TVP38/TMEM64 family)
MIKHNWITGFLAAALALFAFTNDKFKEWLSELSTLGKLLFCTAVISLIAAIVCRNI